MIGIDIGTKYVKICTAEKKGEEFYDILSVMKPIPSSGVNQEKEISKIIKNVIKDNKIKVKEVAIAVGSPELIVRKLDLPIMPLEELKSTIKLQAERMIYADLNEMDIDFHAMPSEANNKMQVIFVAVPSGIVNKNMQIIQDASLDPMIMDINNLAFANCFLTFEANILEQTVILVDIGYANSNFIILNGGRFCFTGNVEFGSKNVVAEIKSEMEISESKAEELLKQTEKWKEIGLNIKGVYRKCTPDLLEAIYKSIEYCKSQHLVVTIDKMLMTGGGSLLPELDEFFSEILGVDTQRWNAFDKIKLLKDKRSGPYMSVALGLALRNLK